MRALAWVRSHDRGYAALRRAGRTAIVMPALFAVGTKVVDDAMVATFAVFGSFAMLLLVDFGGPLRDRVDPHRGLRGVGEGPHPDRAMGVAAPAGLGRRAEPGSHASRL